MFSVFDIWWSSTTIACVCYLKKKERERGYLAVITSLLDCSQKKKWWRCWSFFSVYRHWTKVNDVIWKTKTKKNSRVNHLYIWHKQHDDPIIIIWIIVELVSWFFCGLFYLLLLLLTICNQLMEWINHWIEDYVIINDHISNKKWPMMDRFSMNRFYEFFLYK